MWRLLSFASSAEDAALLSEAAFFCFRWSYFSFLRNFLASSLDEGEEELEDDEDGGLEGGEPGIFVVGGFDVVAAPAAVAFGAAAAGGVCVGAPVAVCPSGCGFASNPLAGAAAATFAA